MITISTISISGTPGTYDRDFNPGMYSCYNESLSKDVYEYVSVSIYVYLCGGEGRGGKQWGWPGRNKFAPRP